MEPLPNMTNPTSIVVNQEEASLSQNQELILIEHRKNPDLSLVNYQGFYFPSRNLPNIKAFQQRFQPHDTDIIIVSKPKSGTTWLKSLVYSIVNRTRYTNSNHPLLTKNPHELVRGLEGNVYSLEKSEVLHFLASIESPRIFSTHLPYDLLPESIKGGQSKCKIVFMARNPFDTVVSLWTFMMRNFPWLKEERSLEDFVEKFCKGEEVYGPSWDHMLGYWKESLEKPTEILFLKYEEVHEDGVSEIKKLAEFLGFGFSEEETRKGVIQEILRLCSIENLKNLEVNKTGSVSLFKKDSFFRKGKVGDWVNYLSPPMVERIDQVMREKFVGSGLEFKIYPQK